MSKLRCILVVLAVFALSLSFAVPEEDVPETPYDESEAADGSTWKSSRFRH